MSERSIIKIDEEKCTGCGLCVPNCAEGALQVIDGKARLISDLFCDGLGACIGHCPEDAITVEQREAEPYDERRVMEENIVPAGANTIRNHLSHLKEHGALEYLREAVEYLKEKNIPVPQFEPACAGGGCPGSASREFKPKKSGEDFPSRSELCQWPVQLRLLSPSAPFLKKADLLIAADCTAFSAGGFHTDYLKGKALAIACPKLDSEQDDYISKIARIIDEAEINTITALIMEVPCCGGLLNIIRQAAERAERKVPVKKIVMSLQGERLSEEWV